MQRLDTKKGRNRPKDNVKSTNYQSINNERNWEMKTRRILMGALALAVVAATVIACTKDKETNVAQQETVTEEVARKPIETYDIDNRIMHDHFDLDFANSAINENNLSKETGSRYVIESARVIDSVPLDINSEIIRKIVILDTEEELSITCWCIGAFVDKEIHDESVHYFVNEDVASGIYEFSMTSEGNVYAVYVNGNTYMWEEVEQIPETAMGKTIVVCVGRNCQSGCDLTPNNDNCTACTPHPGQQGDCFTIKTDNKILGRILKILFDK